MSAADFVARLAPAAAQVEAESGIPHQVLIAIPANETGWGAAMAGNNLFGIKGSNPSTGANTGAVATWEVIGGKTVNILDTFRAYSSDAESMRDFVAFLHDNPRYQPALDAYAASGDPADLVRGIHAAGYATDPAWSDKILSLMGTVDQLWPSDVAAASPSFASSSSMPVLAGVALGVALLWALGVI